MLQKDNRNKVLRLFFSDPLWGFQLREISRKIKLAPTSVKRYLEEFEKENLIKREGHKEHGYPIYFANRDDEQFKFLKKMDNRLLIHESGLIEFLSNSLMPGAIVLFGSASRGEDIGESDIDIFVLCKEKRLNLKSYENKLNRKISIFFSEDFNKLSKELRNNILNGSILKGYLKVF